MRGGDPPGKPEPRPESRSSRPISPDLLLPLDPIKGHRVGPTKSRGAIAKTQLKGQMLPRTKGKEATVLGGFGGDLSPLNRFDPVRFLSPFGFNPKPACLPRDPGAVRSLLRPEWAPGATLVSHGGCRGAGSEADCWGCGWFTGCPPRPQQLFTESQNSKLESPKPWSPAPGVFRCRN